MTRSKKVTAMLAALVLTVSLAAPALALGELDVTHAGSITVSTSDKDFIADYEEQLPTYGQEAVVEVLVYKVADVNEKGVFTPTPAFKEALEGQPYWNDGILNEGLIDTEALLNAAVEVVYPPEAEPAEGADTSDPMYEPTPAFPSDIDPQVIDPVETKIDMSAYGLGLYMLLPQKMQTIQWVYDYSPLLVAVPRIEKKTVEGETGIPAEGEWLYDVTAELKGSRVRRLTDMMIAKTLREYNATLGETTFLFDVQADIDPEGNVFSQLVPLTFSGTGTQSVTVSGIPVGAHVTVTEVYSGASYEVVDGQMEVGWLPLPDEVNGMQRVEFTNLYTDRQNPDTSLVNTWVREGEGWTWQSSGEEAG